METLTRSLASVQKIIKIEPVENSDFLERAFILGWEVVVKKGQFKEGDFCVFFEIDSLLPDVPRYEFLKKNSWNTQKQKIRLKTVRLRGALSQGLAMPISDFDNIPLIEGLDLTEELSVEKYEPAIPAELNGKARSFNWPISRTNEIRIQTTPKRFIDSINGKPYYISMKLDGTSASFILTENDYHVCSHNYSIAEGEDSTYWKMSNTYNIRKILEDYKESFGKYLSIQGEIVGPGIQSNKLGLEKVDLYVFNIINTLTNERLSLTDALLFCRDNGLKFVPILENGNSFPYSSAEELLELAKGKYIEVFQGANKDQDMEGIVIRTKDQSITFKVINNDFLLKEKD